MVLVHGDSQLEALRQQLSAAQAQKAELEQQLSQTDAGLRQIDQMLSAQGLDRTSARQTLKQLEAASGQIPASAAALRRNYAQLSDAKRQLEDGWEEYWDGQEELEDAKEQLDEARAELEDAEAELSDGKAELDDALGELNDGEAEYADGKADLEDGWQEYYDGLQELEDGKQTLAEERADGQRELNDALAELRDGEAEYADGYQEYLDGKAEAEEKIADAEDQLADARRKIADIGDSEWYILSRDSNPGYLGFGQDADRMGNLSSVFPVLFFLVAALVCLTTMTRMVDEQRVQIGSLKALGYTRWTISRKYLGYGLLPALMGGGLGLGIGFTLFPTMIFTAYQIMYDVPDIELTFYPGIASAAVGAAAACTTVSTLAACLATLADTPASLMRPRAPKAGKWVLLDFWGSWCIWCRKGNPALVELYQKYGGKDFEIIGLAARDREDNWKKAIAEDGLTWRHANLALNEGGNDLPAQYNVSGFPTKILIDPEGNISVISVGYHETDDPAAVKLIDALGETYVQ